MDLYSLFHVLHVAVEDEPPAQHEKLTLTASSSETSRYPKRNVERKNYHESSDEETDPGNFCFCEYDIFFYAVFDADVLSTG